MRKQPSPHRRVCHSPVHVTRHRTGASQPIHAVKLTASVAGVPDAQLRCRRPMLVLLSPVAVVVPLVDLAGYVARIACGCDTYDLRHEEYTARSPPNDRAAPPRDLRSSCRPERSGVHQCTAVCQPAAPVSGWRDAPLCCAHAGVRSPRCSASATMMPSVPRI